MFKKEDLMSSFRWKEYLADELETMQRGLDKAQSDISFLNNCMPNPKQYKVDADSVVFKGKVFVPGEQNNDSILAVPNSDYIYDEITNRVDCGHRLINLDYDPRLCHTGYTEALGRVAERFYNEHIVVVVNSHDQVERVAHAIPKAYEVYTNDFKWIRSILGNDDFVLVDNSIKELEPEIQEALQYELITKGTVVTFSDLGLTI